LSAANSAVSTANTASSNASTALSTANTAASNASAAVSTANAADGKADQAIAAVANAILYDIVANVAAIPPTPANNDAVEVANSTGIQSFTPLSGLPAGFVGDSGLSVRIVYSSATSSWVWIQYFPNDPENRYGDAIVTLQGDVSVLQTDLGTAQSDILGLDSSKLDATTAASTYLTQTNAGTTYQPLSGMSSYLTTTAAGSTYAPLANPTFTGTVTIPAGASISGYLTSASAASTYQTQAGMSSYLTTSSASSTYLTQTNAASTYQTQAGMSSYLTTATANSTYLSQYSVTTTATSKTLTNRERCTVTAAGQTITLPASPAAGWEVSITIAGTFTDTTINRNGTNIMSLAENLTIDKADVTVTFYYVDATRGWRII
jgi:hypothetical protein